jgi:hypothetical protein
LDVVLGKFEGEEVGAGESVGCCEGRKVVVEMVVD